MLGALGVSIKPPGEATATAALSLEVGEVEQEVQHTLGRDLDWETLTVCGS